MSFDLFFQPCRYGRKPVKRKNPFTGADNLILPTEPLTAAELKAVRAVLKKAGGQPDDGGSYLVEFEDGGGAEVIVTDLAEGCMVAVGSLTPDLLGFLADLLRAGNWALLPAMDGDIAITVSPDSVKNAPDDFPEVVTCDSADDLGVLLGDGFKAWKKYRDRVTRKASRVGTGKKPPRKR
ncbi:MAG TPA: hypothetical protein VM597_24480 [Gemmataceae bacterium]|jgi:hypothetical protein|nr:hypothetical protein [Gemmataceae bacterium]